MVEIGDSVRGKDIYIIQTGTKDVNNNIMELLIMAYACKTSSAKSIVGVIPYLPYSKQCKMRKRGCIVSKLLAKMMCTSGLTHVITMDLHQKEIQGFFECPVDNLRASPFLLQYIQESVSGFLFIKKFILNVLYIISLSNILKKNLETCFSRFVTLETQKCKKVSPVSQRILSFFLIDQFLFCKRCLIGSGGTLTGDMPLGVIQDCVSRFVKFPCIFSAPVPKVRFSIL